MQANPIFTVGHGNLQGAALARRLMAHGAQLVVDVRALPFSRHNPDANQQNLAAALKAQGIGYLWMGDRLGGKPRGKRGRFDIGAKRADPRFWHGIEALLELTGQARIALLCAEENPRRCHRRFLITRALIEKGFPAENVLHLRHDGRVETEAEIQAEEAPLFRGELPNC